MNTHAQEEIDDALKQPIMDYFYGTYEADENKIRQAFHKDAKIAGFF